MAGTSNPTPTVAMGDPVAAKTVSVSWVRPAFGVAVAVGLAILVTLAIFLTRNSFLQMFNEFEFTLPAVTLLAMSILMPVISAINAVFTIAINSLLFLVAAITRDLIPQCLRIAKIANRVSIVLSVLIAMVYLIGAFLPLWSLLTALE